MNDPIDTSCAAFNIGDARLLTPVAIREDVGFLVQRAAAQLAFSVSPIGDMLDYRFSAASWKTIPVVLRVLARALGILQLNSVVLY